jgi:hypothetical protein
MNGQIKVYLTKVDNVSLFFTFFSASSKCLIPILNPICFEVVLSAIATATATATADVFLLLFYLTSEVTLVPFDF